MELIEALNWRYAVKQFSQQKVVPELLEQLLEATRLSASSYGLQPYRLVVVKSASVRQQLLPFSYGQNKVANCSHLIVFAAQSQFGMEIVDSYIQRKAELSNLSQSHVSQSHVSQSNVSQESLQGLAEHMKALLKDMNPAQRQEWAHQQAYIALGNFLTSAALLGIDCCPMTGIDFKGFDEVLDLTSKKLTTSVICPIGYRHREDRYQHHPKQRLHRDELVWEL